MNRRENLKALGLLSSHALFPTVLSSFFTSCSSRKEIASYVPEQFSEDELKIVAELCDFILPSTDTPGASEVGVPVFIDKYVLHCFTLDQQKNFKDGLKSWANRSDMSTEEKFALLKEKEQKSHGDDSAEAEFTRSLKNLTLLGYFFSEAGAKAATNYISVPGTFRGCVDINPGQRAELLNGMT